MGKAGIIAILLLVGIPVGIFVLIWQLAEDIVPALATAFIAVSILMMLVILIQKPKGGGLSGAFGGAGGGSDLLGGKTGDVLTWVTVFFFVAFLGLAMGLTWAIGPSAAVDDTDKITGTDGTDGDGEDGTDGGSDAIKDLIEKMQNDQDSGTDTLPGPGSDLLPDKGDGTGTPNSDGLLPDGNTGTPNSDGLIPDPLKPNGDGTSPDPDGTQPDDGGGDDND